MNKMPLLGIFIALILFSLLSCSDFKEGFEAGTKVEGFPNAVVERDENKNAYFGDLHLHTSWSFDAFIYNNRTTPDDAYRFGKGEAIDFSEGGKIQNQYPLDFMAVTDHAEYMGVMKQMIDPDHSFFQASIGRTS